jgi:hypothetical protein
MENAVKWALIMLLAASASLAQPLRVFSEFAAINAQGEVVAPESPREILSPAIVRNGFTSFQIVIQAPKGTPFTLHVGQNPADAVNVTLYRESGERLERVELPYQSESTQVLWMDLWADQNAPVRRIKVEPQLFINDDWVVYPMEARVVEATVPDDGIVSQPASKPLEATPWEAMRNFLCGGKPAGGPASDSTGSHFRNVRQDLALAAKAPKEELQRVFGACATPPPSNPESYLRIRDYLLRLR